MSAGKFRTCRVDPFRCRVDVLYEGITFLGAAIQGDGGVMGDASVDGWTDIARRFVGLRDRREMVRVFTVSVSGQVEFFDAPAAECKLLAVYTPGYARR